MKRGVTIAIVVGWVWVVIFGVHSFDPGFTARWHVQVLGLSALVTSLIDWAYGAFMRNQIAPMKVSILPTENAERLANQLRVIDHQFSVIWWTSVFMKVLLAVAALSLANVTSASARLYWGIAGYGAFALTVVLLIVGIAIFEIMKRWKVAFESAERFESERRARLEALRNFSPQPDIQQDQHLQGYSKTIPC
jgi:hypothetical protein